MANSFDTEREAVEIDSVAKLAENIVIRLPGADDELVRRMLQSAYADFCRLSCALVGRKSVRVAEDEVIDELSVRPSCSERYVDFVKSVSCSGREMREGVEYSVVGDMISFPYKMTNCVIEVETVEVPTNGSERAPMWFLRKYGRAIESGALARIMSMTGRAWSDPNQARIEAVNYNDAITSAKLSYYCGSEKANGSASAVCPGTLV